MENKLEKDRMPMARKNYRWMLVSAVLVVAGFVCMAGGGSPSPDEFNEAMFSFRRITLSVLLVLGGLSLMIFAIMKRFKEDR